MNRKVFIRMFKEIVKHGEIGCYYCKQITKELNLKEWLEQDAKVDSP